MTEKLCEPVGEIEKVGECDMAVRVDVGDPVTVRVDVTEGSGDGELDCAPDVVAEVERERVPVPDREGDAEVDTDLEMTMERDTDVDAVEDFVTARDGEVDGLFDEAIDALTAESDADGEMLGLYDSTADKEPDVEILKLGVGVVLDEPDGLTEAETDFDTSAEPVIVLDAMLLVVRVAIESSDCFEDEDGVCDTDGVIFVENENVVAPDSDGETLGDALEDRDTVWHFETAVEALYVRD